MKRRGFLSAAGGGVLAMTAGSAKRVRGASSRVRVALVGCGQRGTLVAGEMSRVSGVEIGVVCDVYTRNAERAIPPHGSAWQRWTAAALPRFRPGRSDSS